MRTILTKENKSMMNKIIISGVFLLVIFSLPACNGVSGAYSDDPKGHNSTQIYGNVLGDSRKLEALEKFMGKLISVLGAGVKKILTLTGNFQEREYNKG